MWYRIDSQSDTSTDPPAEQVRFPEDSPWFDGHFPGRPILPGIAQLALVADMLRRRLRKDARVAAVSRVRFKQVVRPDENLEVTVKPGHDSETRFDFRICRRGQLVCSGILHVQARGE